jgi:hypothetical protein
MALKYAVITINDSQVSYEFYNAKRARKTTINSVIFMYFMTLHHINILNHSLTNVLSLWDKLYESLRAEW